MPSSTSIIETFPFPANYESSIALEQIGREYYEFRGALMVKPTLTPRRDLFQ
jgi:hypothetical protein